MIDGRPMFVSRCDPDKNSRPPGFKFKTGLEKNKLFVKGKSLVRSLQRKNDQVKGRVSNIDQVKSYV